MVAPDAAVDGIEADSPERGDAPRSRVVLGSGFEQVALLTASLDDDPNREQIMAFRVSGSTDSPIQVGVIDFQDDGVSWRMIWQATTQALNPDTLRITLIDLVDDAAPEIVVLGTAGAHQQTLDAYRRTPAAEAPGDAYREIARIAVHGTLEIGDAGGENGRTDAAAAVPLIAHVKAPESESGLDLLRLTYGWDAEPGKYLLRRTEPISRPADPEAPFVELYSTSGTDPYEMFLAGPWYRDAPSRTRDGATRREMIVFAPGERLISVYDGEILEEFEWLESHRPLAARLDVWVRNLTIEAIRKTFSIEARSDAEIRFQVRGPDSYDRSDATFRRLTLAEQEVLLADEVPVETAVLSGIYRSADGVSLDFAGDRFVWTYEGHVFEGGFALRGHVLSMKIVGPRGEHRGYLTYRVEYSEAASSERIDRSLRLTRVGSDPPVTDDHAAPVLHLSQAQSITDQHPPNTE